MSTLQSLISYVDEIYVSYGAPDKIYGNDSRQIDKITRLASENNLILLPSRIRHIGTDRCGTVLKNIKDFLNTQVEILFNAEADGILRSRKRVTGVKLKDGTNLYADYVILAPGREGSRWLEKETRRLRLTILRNPVDIGVRVETSAPVFEHLTKITDRAETHFRVEKHFRTG